MGEVIGRHAAADDILGDARTTLNHARARGGFWQEAAEQRLVPVVGLGDSVVSRLSEALAVYEPLLAAMDAANLVADRLVGEISDTYWNAIGRPGSDVAMDLTFPGGIAEVNDGPTDQQPERMELLAELLEARFHPRVPEALTTELAARVRQGAAELERHTEALRKPAARVALLRRMKTLVARHTQAELVRLKRRYLSEGATEAEIHTVIPDRPRPTKQTEPTPPG